MAKTIFSSKNPYFRIPKTKKEGYQFRPVEKTRKVPTGKIDEATKKEIIKNEKYTTELGYLEGEFNHKEIAYLKGFEGVNIVE